MDISEIAMGRPPLHPDPAGLDLLKGTDPLDWDKAFGFGGPLEVEIGCGAGGFALEYARRHPGIRLVALEWRKKFARLVEQRAKAQSLLNLKVIEADARVVVPQLFGKGSLRGIHFQFPDPWWKRAHLKRSVLTPSFAKLLAELLAPGGWFDLRTDVKERADEMLEVLQAVGLLNALGRGVFHPYNPEEVPSTRERRYLTTGQPVYRAKLQKPLEGEGA
jgi:tRNA (guanine-N7-)-methyltransferase